MNKNRCPKCNSLLVYSEHSMYSDKWRIYCLRCKFSTQLHDTWKQARAEWDNVENEVEDGECK
jgi:phage FluMu protein Com